MINSEPIYILNAYQPALSPIGVGQHGIVLGIHLRHYLNQGLQLVFGDPRPM